MNSEVLLKEWIKGAKINSIAHFKAASRFHVNNRKLGLIASIAGAVVTSSLFVSLSEDETKKWLWITGIISIFSTALTTAYSFLKQSEFSEKHYRAGTDYGHLRKKMEVLLIRGNVTSDEMNGLNEELYELTEKNPPVPQDLYDAVLKDYNFRNTESKEHISKADE